MKKRSESIMVTQQTSLFNSILVNEAPQERKADRKPGSSIEVNLSEEPKLKLIERKMRRSKKHFDRYIGRDKEIEKTLYREHEVEQE